MQSQNKWLCSFNLGENQTRDTSLRYQDYPNNPLIDIQNNAFSLDDHNDAVIKYIYKGVRTSSKRIASTDITLIPVCVFYIHTSMATYIINAIATVRRFHGQIAAPISIIWHWDILFLEKGNGLLFTMITDQHARRAAVKS